MTKIRDEIAKVIQARAYVLGNGEEGYSLNADHIADAILSRFDVHPKGQVGKLVDAANNLTCSTLKYRSRHDLFGDGSKQAGRAWDEMRYAEANVRDALIPFLSADQEAL